VSDRFRLVTIRCKTALASVPARKPKGTVSPAGGVVSRVSIPHILIVDDDRQIRAMLARFMREHGLRVSQAQNGAEMRAALDLGRFDLVILDVMMPGEDGFSLCREIRATNTIPIILLTAMTADTDRIVGLELGADDYVTKPFNPRELLARVRAILRRVSVVPSPPRNSGRSVFRFAGWMLDAPRRVLLSPDGVLTDLTSGEFDLLLAFVEHPQQVLNRDQLLDLAHGRASNAFDRSIDVQISRLRRKIEVDPQEPQLIKTVRNGGYVLTAGAVTSDQDQSS
jgi:two-component system OmpR family response regulator